jgi:uncharacterized protein (TIGR00162 family)
MKIDIVVKETPQLNSPVILCGLPGAAFVGKFALDHLVEELHAKPLAEFYSAGFPMQIMVDDSGIGRLMKNEVWYWRNSSSGSDLVLYTGDSQPATAEAEYELSDAAIDYLVKEHGAKKLITLGAYVTGVNVVNPSVFSAASEHDVAQHLEAKGCKLMTDGAITGMNGLLLGMARAKGLEGYALLGETSGLTFDAKASEAILNMLSNLTGVIVDYTNLEKRASEAQAAVRALEALRRGQTPESGQQEESSKKRLGYIS